MPLKAMAMHLGKKDTTTKALRQAIHRACRLMEEHMDRRMPVDELAAKVGLSPFHFQRVFRRVVGESVAQHHARLRIERAAYYLKFSAWQIQEVSYATGFESQASFTRLFSRVYGMSPKAFRAAQGVVPYLRSQMRSRRVPAAEPELNPVPVPTVRIESSPERRLIVLRHFGAVERVPGAWRELLQWAREHIVDLEEARFFGLWFDDWSESTDPNYRYECAILPAQPLNAPPPEPFAVRVMPAGAVAVTTVRGDLATLDRAWKALMYGWLPFSGFQPRLDYVFDEYDAGLVLSPRLMQLVRAAAGIQINLSVPVQAGPAEL